MSTATSRPHEDEVTILARVIARDDHPIAPEIASYLLALDFDKADKARMHDLTLRNQDDDLSEDEKIELRAFARAGTLMSLLKSRARRALSPGPNQSPDRAPRSSTSN
jgi:hypothetical protein